MALVKIDTKNIMTTWEAMNRYADKYFHMVITERVDEGDNDKGYVIYTYDHLAELKEIPRVETKGKSILRGAGVEVEPIGQIGGIIFHERI